MLNRILVKDTHIVALTMIPCIFIKIATSAAMAVLTTSSADLVSPNKKKILMFSSAVWARAWFLWAPFLGASSYFGVLVPLTIFAALSVVGGCLNIVIYHGQCLQMKSLNIKAVALQEKGNSSVHIQSMFGIFCFDLFRIVFAEGNIGSRK